MKIKQATIFRKRMLRRRRKRRSKIQPVNLEWKNRKRWQKLRNQNHWTHMGLGNRSRKRRIHSTCALRTCCSRSCSPFWSFVSVTRLCSLFIPSTIVDLQLPKVADEESAPKELPPEPKPKFKERIITSLGVEGGPTSFKKSKSQNGKSRSFRQRDNDD